MTVTETLKTITADQRDALFTAFNENQTLIIKLEDNFFIGVHVYETASINIINTSGFWSVGRLK